MLRESFTNPTGFELRDFAREIEVPTTVLECYRAGGEPRFPAFVAALRERLGDRFSAESIRGGHYLQLDRPDEVNASLVRFLSSIGTN
jgi:pimeloyl-ACP methyl ester carboxylesterase